MKIDPRTILFWSTVDLIIHVINERDYINFPRLNFLEQKEILTMYQVDMYKRK